MWPLTSWSLKVNAGAIKKLLEQGRTNCSKGCRGSGHRFENTKRGTRPGRGGQGRARGKSELGVLE